MLHYSVALLFLATPLCVRKLIRELRQVNWAVFCIKFEAFQWDHLFEPLLRSFLSKLPRFPVIGWHFWERSRLSRLIKLRVDIFIPLNEALEKGSASWLMMPVAFIVPVSQKWIFDCLELCGECCVSQLVNGCKLGHRVFIANFLKISIYGLSVIFFLYLRLFISIFLLLEYDFFLIMVFLRWTNIG